MCNCALSNQSAHDSVFPTLKKGKNVLIENFEKVKFHMVKVFFEHNLVGFFFVCVYCLSSNVGNTGIPTDPKGVYFSHFLLLHSITHSQSDLDLKVLCKALPSSAEKPTQNSKEVLKRFFWEVEMHLEVSLLVLLIVELESKCVCT